MGGRRAHLATGLLAAIAVSAGAPGVANAECIPVPARPADVVLAVAFVAEVTEVSDEVDASDSAPFDWHVELAVEREFGRSVPSTVVINGWEAGCTWLRPAGLHVGDAVFFATDRLREPELWGPLVIWRAEAGGWAFADDALWPSGESDYWSAPMREADTLTEILAVVGAPPDTSTGPPRGPEERDIGLPMLALAASGAAFLLVMRRRHSRRSTPLTAGSVSVGKSDNLTSPDGGSGRVDPLAPAMAVDLLLEDKSDLLGDPLGGHVVRGDDRDEAG